MKDKQACRRHTREAVKPSGVPLGDLGMPDGELNSKIKDEICSEADKHLKNSL